MLYHCQDTVKIEKHDCRFYQLNTNLTGRVAGLGGFVRKRQKLSAELGLQAVESIVSKTVNTVARTWAQEDKDG